MHQLKIAFLYSLCIISISGCGVIHLKNNDSQQLFIPSSYHSVDKSMHFTKGLVLGEASLPIVINKLAYNCRTQKISIKTNSTIDNNKVVFFTAKESTDSLYVKKDSIKETPYPNNKKIEYIIKIEDDETIFFYSPNYKVYEINIRKVKERCNK